jgi:hypothetical protein
MAAWPTSGESLNSFITDAVWLYVKSHVLFGECPHASAGKGRTVALRHCSTG